MTPAARVQAAIDILDRVLAGAAAEQALTAWARGARYAGSKDRAAVRDHVFQALRCKRSYAARGGAETGRGIMLGQLRARGVLAQDIFTGEGHAPAALTEDEDRAGAVPHGAAAFDLPDWLWFRFEAGLGRTEAQHVAELLQERAPVALRVNPRMNSSEQAIEILSKEGIEVRRLDDPETALIVTSNARRVAQSEAYTTGLVELQDASSQAAMAALSIAPGARVLDYCAGGGGKVLAMAARVDGTWFAHDVAVERMRDLPARAARAGVRVDCLTTKELQECAPFDLVLCDVPCSGSGTWRRAPEAKWRLTPERLLELQRMQADILAQASRLVRPGGHLAYATCSVLREENEAQIVAFLDENSGWSQMFDHRWPVSSTQDGFFLSSLTAPV